MAYSACVSAVCRVKNPVFFFHGPHTIPILYTVSTNNSKITSPVVKSQIGNYSENTLVTIQCDLITAVFCVAHVVTWVDNTTPAEVLTLVAVASSGQSLWIWCRIPLFLQGQGVEFFCSLFWRTWDLSYLSQMPSVGLLWRPHVPLEQLGHCSFGEGHDCDSGKKYSGMNASILCSLWIAVPAQKMQKAWQIRRCKSVR